MLIFADVGVGATSDIIERLREEIRPAGSGKKSR